MLAPRQLEQRYVEWNRYWKAPHGSVTWRRILPKGLWTVWPFVRLVGPFVHQPNSSTRAFEYPWAYYASRIERGSSVIDLGGALSGLAFACARGGASVTVVDPFVEYGATMRPQANPRETVARLNRGLRTDVRLLISDLGGADLRSESADTIVCISTLEHLKAEDLQETLLEVGRVLKPGGRFVVTVDLFLNLRPFSKREANQYGTNVSVADLVSNSGLELEEGRTSELYGFETFNALAVLESLEKFAIGVEYPVLSQVLVLRKRSV